MSIIVGFKDYEIKQESVYRGNLTVTFGFEADGKIDIDDFPPDKYADFMKKLTELIREYNEEKPYSILG